MHDPWRSTPTAWVARERAGPYDGWSGPRTGTPRTCSRLSASPIVSPRNRPTMKRTRRWLILAAAAGVILAIAAACTVVVDETEFAVVTRFGRVAAVFGGSGAGESASTSASSAGLHAKAPWDVVIRIDRRFRVFDPAPREMMTGDKRNLEVAPYVVWRVADPVAFLKGSGSDEQAEARLGERVSAGLSDAIGRRDLASLASTDPAKWSLDGLTDEVLAAVAPSARDELGVEVLDVRLRRFGHPVEVRPAVFDLIRSERRQVAAKLRAEGEAQYLTITSQADRARETMLAEAQADARRTRGQAEAEATRLLNDAHGRDPRFFEFLKTLESYRSILDERATVVLSASSPLLKLLVEGPSRPEPSDSSSPSNTGRIAGESPVGGSAAGNPADARTGRAPAPPPLSTNGPRPDRPGGQ